jgi:hypothetical protein
MRRVMNINQLRWGHALLALSAALLDENKNFTPDAQLIAFLMSLLRE